MATADVLDLCSSEPVAGGLAASVLDLTKDTERGISSTTAECSDLLVGGLGQPDVDRRLALCFRVSTISALRSSPSGTVRPAR